MSFGEVFAGVRIVELAQYVYVPGATVLMADHGAEVIKVEPPGVGDPYRNLQIGAVSDVGSVSLPMEQNNRGKKSIALDLKRSEGREALLRLIESADVFVTSLRPKAIVELGLDVDNLRARNPKIIYVRGNGLGFKGEEANKPGFDASAFWARGGLCYALTRPGQPATSPRPAMGDHSGSMAIAFGIASALYRLKATGEPTVVENSLLSTALWILSSDVTYSQAPGYQTHSDAPVRSPLMNTYSTRDGRLIQLMLLNPDPYWRSFCVLVGLEALVDDERFNSNAARMKNASDLIALIQDRLGSKDWAEWQADFDRWEAPWELIREITELPEDPQVLANEMVFDREAGGERILLVSGPTSFDGRASPSHSQGSPELGADTQTLLSDLGYTAEQIDDLRASGAIG